MTERDELLAESITRQLGEGGGVWAPCSGCHESIDGYSVSPIDPVFKCYLGSGCHECGGIGATWDTTDYDHMARSIMEADAKSAAPGTVRPAQCMRMPDEVSLANPNFVHINMLRGGIAKPTWSQIQHLYPEEFAALRAPEAADAGAVAWICELAYAIDSNTREYSDWRQHLSSVQPHVPPGSIRNLRALYAHPSTDGKCTTDGGVK